MVTQMHKITVDTAQTKLCMVGVIFRLQPVEWMAKRL